jgi:hypothetical protein
MDMLISLGYLTGVAENRGLALWLSVAGRAGSNGNSLFDDLLDRIDNALKRAP